MLNAEDCIDIRVGAVSVADKSVLQGLVDLRVSSGVHPNSVVAEAQALLKSLSSAVFVQGVPLSSQQAA